MEQLKADYLVIGSGAMGMAFVDTMLNETDATFVIVDRHDRPGGHWNDAYPFVRLHQPSAFYGVNSRKLGHDTIDQFGWNRGLAELASAPEVLTYFEQVMNHQFIPSGRVAYHPMCEYLGDGRFRSRVSEYEATVTSEKVVDSTYMQVQVPSTRPPAYKVEDGVQCIALNDLPRVAGNASGYVVVGAGKTGMDACLWLLDHHVDPDQIRWIMPRDSWLLDRARIQPGNLAGGGGADGTSIAATRDPETLDEMLELAEQTGGLFRLDPDVKPTMYRCATVTSLELEQLRRIKNVVRMGRVSRITPTEVHLDGGVIPTSAHHLHIDCTADGLATRPVTPVFDGRKITLQAVRTCQQVFSAAFLGHIEATYSDDPKKNSLAHPVPHPDTELDWLRVTIQTARNHMAWAAEPELGTWLGHARLDGFSVPPDPDAPKPSEQALAKMTGAFHQWLERQQRILADAESARG